MTDWVIPCLLAGVAAAAMGRRTDVYGALTDGAAEGLRVLGLVFGAVVLLSGDAGLFLAADPGGAIVTVLSKGIACGAAAGLCCR